MQWVCGVVYWEHFDYGKLADSVDQKKASEAIDKDKLKGSVSEEGIDYKKVYDSVDKTKAKESIDMEKARGALNTDSPLYK